MTKGSPVVLWDQPIDPPGGLGEVLCWQSYAHEGSIDSIPRYLEGHAERLRARYLCFIHDLGQLEIGGRRVVDHLDLGDGFSFWWMTQLAEKSPLKSPRIYDCLRLLALEEMLGARSPSSLRLVSADKQLSRAVRTLCANLKIEFFFRPLSRQNRRWSLRRLYSVLPHPLKGLLSLRHVALRWPLRRARLPDGIAAEADLLVCSYFIHLDPALCAQGRFHSRQWEDLPALLRQAGRRVSWIQLFLFSAAVPDVRTGLDWMAGFNRDACGQSSQTFLESYLTCASLWRASKKWLQLNIVRLRLGRIASSFYAADSHAWLWPLLQEDWHTSVAGPVALGNCIAVELFDAALARRPRQTIGIYLCENQAWEKALLRAWRKHNHGEVIGVQHATAPFWHLYYFEDPRSLSTGQPCGMPQPDRLAVNGLAARKAFEAAGYPTERLVDVEALRYISLSGLAEQRSRDPRQRERLGNSPASPLKVLILGDLMPTSMHCLKRLLEGAVDLLHVRCEFTLKPHPGYATDVARFSRLSAASTNEPLGKILSTYDVAIAANVTSAAVDAYVAGLPVIIALDGCTLNMSPLRGEAGAYFASTPSELANALRVASSTRAGADSRRQAFFFLDPELPRWRRLLGLAFPREQEAPRSACR